MTRSIRFLLLSLLLTAAAAAQPVEELYAHLGTIIKFSSENAMFPHEERADGHQYGETRYPAAEHYSDDTVLLFIPQGFEPAEAVDMVFYFHGWWNNIDTSIVKYNLLDQFYASGRNAVFVFPEGPKNAADSFGGKLEEAGRFSMLVDDALLQLAKAGVTGSMRAGDIWLAGHSGAYRVISQIITRGGKLDHISGVILFDALYGQRQRYVYWLEHYYGKFINIYSPDGGTKRNSEDLMQDFTTWGIPFHYATEGELMDENIAMSRIVFIDSDLGHAGVVYERKQLQRFLENSGLDPLY